MSLLETLRKDLSEATHRQDKKRVSTLRLLFAAIKNKEIEERKESGLSEEEVLAVVQKEVKKRRESIGEFERGRRMDLVASEREELGILEKYVPAELSEEEIRFMVQKGIKELGTSGNESFGALMKIIMPSLKSRASGDRISRIAREELAKGK